MTPEEQLAVETLLANHIAKTVMLQIAVEFWKAGKPFDASVCKFMNDEAQLALDSEGVFQIHKHNPPPHYVGRFIVHTKDGAIFLQ